MSRKRAHPFWAIARADRRMLNRRGVGLACWAATLAAAALVRFVCPPLWRESAAALLTLAFAVLLGLCTTGTVALYEKNRHIHTALYASGVKARHYILAKCMVIGLLGTLTGCFLIWFSDPEVLTYANRVVNWRSVTAGDGAALGVAALCLLLCSVLCVLLSLPVAALCGSGGSYLTVSLLLAAALIAPVIWELFAPLPEAAGYCPTVLLARTLLSSAKALNGQWLMARLAQIAALAGWLAVFGLLARLSVNRMLKAKGGVTV